MTELHIIKAYAAMCIDGTAVTQHQSNRSVDTKVISMRIITQRVSPHLATLVSARRLNVKHAITYIVHPEGSTVKQVSTAQHDAHTPFGRFTQRKRSRVMFQHSSLDNPTCPTVSVTASAAAEVGEGTGMRLPLPEHS